MPFGFFGISDEKMKVKKEKKEKVVKEKALPDVKPEINIPPAQQMDLKKINVLLICETVALGEDFLCSLKLNLDETVVNGGLSCFTTDPFTTASIIETKKNIEKCFRGDPEVRWPVYGDMTDDKSKHYRLNISVSGMPNKVLEADFTLSTPDMNLTADIAGANAIWVLTPDATGGRVESLFEGKVKNILYSNASALKEKKVFFVVSQFEKQVRFRDEGAEAEIPHETRKDLYDATAGIFEETMKSVGVVGKMCMVQIYGGLELLERDGLDRPVFYVNLDGSFGSYCPVGCHIPLFHTINAIRNDGAVFFFDAEGERLYDAVQKSFSDYNGRKQWDAQLIGLER